MFQEVTLNGKFFKPSLLHKFFDIKEIIIRFQDQLDYRDCAKVVLQKNLHQKVIELVIEKFEK